MSKRKGSKMSELIKQLLAELASAGISVQGEQVERIETRLRQQFGGERIYVPSLPKQTHNRIAKAARVATRTQAERALVVGISVRQLRRIERGR